MLVENRRKFKIHDTLLLISKFFITILAITKSAYHLFAYHFFLFIYFQIMRFAHVTLFEAQSLFNWKPYPSESATYRKDDEERKKEKTTTNNKEQSYAPKALNVNEKKLRESLAVIKLLRALAVYSWSRSFFLYIFLSTLLIFFFFPAWFFRISFRTSLTFSLVLFMLFSLRRTRAKLGLKGRNEVLSRSRSSIHAPKNPKSPGNSHLVEFEDNERPTTRNYNGETRTMTA